MQRSSSNAGLPSASMRPGPSQAGSQPPAGRPATSFAGKPAGGSVSRSEAGVSVDLSAASYTAALGEDHMEALQGGSVGGSTGQKPVQRAKAKEAEKWFEDSNRNASTRGNVSFVDDDPPFHLPSHIPSEFSGHVLPMRMNNGGLHPPSLLPMQSMHSSGSEEFRSVIDDLTVENKKLKKENRQLKRRQVTHTHPDKLFEVRMHGLDPREKKQLMQMLRQFNDSLSISRGSSEQRPSKKRSKGSSNKPSSSSTLHSNSNPVDSAYASGSTSGNASGSQSMMAESRTVGHSESTRRVRGAEKDQNVRSYIANQSRSLLPRQPVVLTEMARKKLVVRKMEQLYTGKPNTVKKNSQSAQQQQISTEAANEHKRQSEAGGHTLPTEGSREAAILPLDSDIPNLQHENSIGNGAAQDSAVNTPDQRPTRPLDLDLSLAQNPAENIAYIRHLGFKSKTSERKKIDQTQADGEGIWVPLNLMMNLAQLHTLNVTPDFVRQALKEISAKFEFSSDETRIRWKGGVEGTRMSGETGSSTGSKENSPNDAMQDVGGNRAQSPSRSRSSKPSTSEQATGAIKSSGGTGSGTKTGSNDISASTGITSSGNATGSKRPLFFSSTREDSFGYQPIFLHGANSEEEGEYFLDEDDSLLSSGMHEDTTGSGSGQRSKKMPLPPKEEGAVIFYHRARFCTDLSGDHDIVPVNTTQYVRATSDVLGSDRSKMGIISEVKGLLNASESIRRHAALEIVDDTPVNIFHGSPMSIRAGVALSDPFPLPATGMYETTLTDNLGLWPKYQQVVRTRSKPAASASRRYLRIKLMGADTANRIASIEKFEVSLIPNGCEKRDLPPSEFPSPGFYNQWSSSESADGWSESDDEDESKSLNDNAIDVPEIPPTFGNTAFESHSGEDDDSDGEEGQGGPDAIEVDADDDDDEIDLLAYERQQNADDIARREREWEEQQKEGDDDVGSDGKRSSAATVGDRSFLSEEDNMSPGRASAGAIAGQKREREEPTLPPESSPAKRIESNRTRNGRK